MRAIRTLAATLVLLTTAVVVFGQADDDAQENLFDPLYELYDYIETHFYKPEVVDSQEALYGAMRGMVEHLGDPYSEFLDPPDWTRFDESLEGEFSGVGIEITLVDRILTVITPLIGTPAEAAGVLAGDKILWIDDESTEGISLIEAATKIRGEVGTTVVLTVRHESGATEEIPIVRDRIVVDPVRYRVIDGTIGYVQILRFEDDTTRMVDEALASFDLQHAGIGAVLGFDDVGGVVVASVQSGSSAEAAGLTAGDRIRAITGMLTAGLDEEEIDTLARGERGTIVDLEIEREGGTEVVSILRDSSVAGLILDLRSNAGGLMDQAISVASRFVDEGILLKTDGRLQGPRSFYTRSNSIPNLPLAVLINRGTASSSEITAGAIRDNQMGILIGGQSFGKGVYQQLIEFDDGSALKITTGEYFTPNGSVVHNVGLTPDILTDPRTEPIRLSDDLRLELVSDVADGRGREPVRPYPWHAPGLFEISIAIELDFGGLQQGSQFTFDSASASLVVSERFAPPGPIPGSLERVVEEGQDPIEVASVWIREHTGREMPFELAAEEAP
jgi:carboxyl-terminal processing protease